MSKTVTLAEDLAEAGLNLQGMDEVTRALVQRLLTTVQQQQVELKHKETLLDKLRFEMAVLKRLKFAAKSEALGAEQRSLLEESLEEDLQALGEEIEQMQPAAPKAARQQPKRLSLPAQLPRQEIRHEPDSTICGCGCQMKRIGEDIAEKLDYPGNPTWLLQVPAHPRRGLWLCSQPPRWRAWPRCVRANL